MIRNEAVSVVGVVDNVDPDNAAQIMALMAPQFDLKGVVVTGRAANDNPEAAIDDISPADSAFRTALNAVRMRNFIDATRSGRDIPVFVGTPAPRTLVPHRLHVDELAFHDLLPGQLELLRRGAHLSRLGLAGDIHDAASFLRSDEADEFSLVVGGPMTDVAALLDDPLVKDKARDIFTQFGMFGFGERGLMDFGGDMPRGRRQFNVACDPEAAHRVLTTFPKPIRLYPTDVTRVDAIGFRDGQALHDFLPVNEASGALADLYGKGYELMIKPRGEMIYMHDIAPALGCVGVHGTLANPYDERVIAITHVPHEDNEASRFGEIDIAYAPEVVGGDARYVATGVNAERYLRVVRTLLANV